MTRYDTNFLQALDCSCNVVLQHAPCHAITASPPIYCRHKLLMSTHIRHKGLGHLHKSSTSCFAMFQEMEAALFKGCGFVPDLLSLQAWLECAWKAGFDTAGGDMLGNVMQGSHQWIGTTECAALLRFFGLKAQIIDFTGMPHYVNVWHESPAAFMCQYTNFCLLQLLIFMHAAPSICNLNVYSTEYHILPCALLSSAASCVCQVLL